MGFKDSLKNTFPRTFLFKHKHKLDSPQVKRALISSMKTVVYVLHHKLPDHLNLKFDEIRKY